MSSFKYSPRKPHNTCESVRECEEESWPSIYLDVDPSQLKDIEVGETLTITITGKVKSLRYDSDDCYGTGASIGMDLRSNEIGKKKETDFIDSMIDGE